MTNRQDAVALAKEVLAAIGPLMDSEIVWSHKTATTLATALLESEEERAECRATYHESQDCDPHYDHLAAHLQQVTAERDGYKAALERIDALVEHDDPDPTLLQDIARQSLTENQSTKEGARG